MGHCIVNTSMFLDTKSLLASPDVNLGMTVPMGSNKYILDELLFLAPIDIA